MSDATARFHPGQQVRVVGSPEKVGVVLDRPPPAQIAGDFWYYVKFATGPANRIPEYDLEEHSGDIGSIDGLLVEGVFGERDAFSKLVTHLKLTLSLRSQIYALDASRTDFYAYQYKPLLKFLESRSHRLLIADEVGLGKTIEAGLIMTEMRQRLPLDRVLVVPPAHLRMKWREELRRRFDLEFDLLDSLSFVALLKEYEEEGESLCFRGILSLQSLRSLRVQTRLQEVSPTFDLVVFDEAGRLRNRDTASHQSARRVIDTASGALLLTATPVQLRNSDFFNLLQLIEPEEFGREDVFEERLRANRPILQALTRLATGGSPAECLESLRAVERTSLAPRFVSSAIYQDIVARLEAARELSIRDRVELQRDVNSLNVLGHVFSRTRKRDVQIQKPTRRAVPYPVKPTEAEREFYARITEVCREAYRHYQDDTIATFAVMMPQRQMASCMLAMVDYVEERFRTKKPQAVENVAELTDLELDGETSPPPESAGLIDWAQLDLLGWRARLAEHDSKWEVLWRALSQILEDDPTAKAVVFAYFKRTLRYLESRLSKGGIRCVRIDGDVPSAPDDPDADERGRRIEAFRDDPKIRVLLTSEVGDEGVDLQFARVLVNYDLPWNPMKVEQRIGRLDRIGQKSPVITIVNLSMEHTIEADILQRLYQRIRIFQESVGDLEAILGDEIRELEKRLFSQELTPEEQAAEIERVARVVERQRDELEGVERAQQTLIGSDEFFLQEIEQARQRGRYLSGAELLIYVRDFLAAHHKRCVLKPAERDGVFALAITPELIEFVKSRVDRDDYGLRTFASRAATGTVKLTTERSVAQEDRKLELLTFHHPLVRAVKVYYDQNESEIHPVSYVAVTASELPPGNYAWFLYEIEISGARPLRDLEPVVFSMDDGNALSPDASETLLGQMLLGARTVATADQSVIPTRDLCTQGEGLLVERLEKRFQERKRFNDALVENQLQSVRETQERILRGKRETLARAQEKGRRESYLRGLETGLKKLESSFELRLRAIEEGRKLARRQRLRGGGVVEVIEDGAT